MRKIFWWISGILIIGLVIVGIIGFYMILEQDGRGYVEDVCKDEDRHLLGFRKNGLHGPGFVMCDVEAGKEHDLIIDWANGKNHTHKITPSGTNYLATIGPTSSIGHLRSGDYYGYLYKDDVFLGNASFYFEDTTFAFARVIMDVSQPFLVIAIPFSLAVFGMAWIRRRSRRKEQEREQE